MADRDHKRVAVYGTAVGLLALGYALHYGWAMVPGEHAAQVWNICGAVARAALLIPWGFILQHPAVWMVVSWWLAEEALVAGCSGLYIARPWPVIPGQAQCSSLLNLDLGIFGSLAVICFVASATVMFNRWRSDSEQ